VMGPDVCQRRRATSTERMMMRAAQNDWILQRNGSVESGMERIRADGIKGPKVRMSQTQLSAGERRNSKSYQKKSERLLSNAALLGVSPRD